MRWICCATTCTWPAITAMSFRGVATILRTRRLPTSAPRPSPTSCSTPALQQWPVPVFGIAAADADAAPPACVTTPGRKVGTDILVVRRTRTIPTAPRGQPHLSCRRPDATPRVSSTRISCATSDPCPDTFALHKKGCVDAADIYEFQTRIYYVSDETIPTLRLLTISGSTSTNEPLVEGIEDMRVEYGRDTDRRWVARRVPQVPVDRRSMYVTVEWANMMSVQRVPSRPQHRTVESATPTPRPTSSARIPLSTRPTTATSGTCTHPWFG